MLPFIHHRLQLLEQLLHHSNSVLAKYTQYELDLAVALTGYLNQAIDTYHGLNQTVAENELLALKAQFVLAEAGTHPMSLERVTSHRREMVRAIALHVLQQSALRLRTDAELAAQKLNEGAGQLRPIALLAFQKGMIPAKGPVGADEIRDIWRRLLEDADVGLAAKQVAMQLSVFDIELLLADLIASVHATLAAPDHGLTAQRAAGTVEPQTPPAAQHHEPPQLERSQAECETFCAVHDCAA